MIITREIKSDAQFLPNPIQAWKTGVAFPPHKGITTTFLFVSQ